MAVMSYRMDKIKEHRKKRTERVTKVIIPTSVSFITFGGFIIVPFFPLVFEICCFLIAVGICTLIHLDDKDNKKILKMLESESWHNATDIRMLPPSIRDTP
jgi:hypothetical protein